MLHTPDMIQMIHRYILFGNHLIDKSRKLMMCLQFATGSEVSQELYSRSLILVTAFLSFSNEITEHHFMINCTDKRLILIILICF